MKLSKVAFAVAGVLAIASGSAFAGQIGSSSVTLATEVIVNDAQIVRAPSNVYTFAGDINAQTNQQLLQLQYTLSAGTWSSQVFTAVNTLVNLPPTATSMLKVSYIDGANLAKNVFPAGTLVAGFVTADRKTLVMNVTIPAANVPDNLLKGAAFQINSSAIAGVDNAGISGLFAVTGAIACFAPDKNLDISFKHFTTHNANTDLINNATPDAEHLRGGSTNTARLINFVQNQIFTFVPATQSSRTDALFLNQRLNGTNYTPVTDTATTVGFVQPGGAAPVAPITRHYFGRVNLKQRANGLDLNYATAYGAATVATPLLATDFEAADDIGNLSSGVIEMKDISVAVNLPTALPAGTVVMLRDGGGVVVLGDVTTAAGQTTITFTGLTAAAAAAFAAPDAAAAAVGNVGGVHLWADFQGNALIPQVTGITVTAKLTKDTVAGAPDQREQDLTCPGTVAGIGGGIKIDIRNYASRTKFPTGNYSTVVRLINNSESQAADVVAQMIYADGKYGPWGVMPSLAPRAVANYSNAQLEAFLTNAAPVANPFGAGTVYTSDQTAAPSYVAPQVVGASSNTGTGDRIRFVSNTGTTLRVQSYLVFPGGVMDVANAQGVDFENSGTRVPVNGVDAQPISQDAINGLAK
jgi:hypothetical protein